MARCGLGDEQGGSERAHNGRGSRVRSLLQSLQEAPLSLAIICVLLVVAWTQRYRWLGRSPAEGRCSPQSRNSKSEKNNKDANQDGAFAKFFTVLNCILCIKSPFELISFSLSQHCLPHTHHTHSCTHHTHSHTEICCFLVLVVIHRHTRCCRRERLSSRRSAAGQRSR